MAARPITLVIGGDEFLASTALAQVRDPLVAKGYAAEDAAASDAQALLNALDTPSLFDAGRVVVVRDADALPAEAVARLAAWAAAPAGRVRLVLVAARGQKLEKALAGVADIVKVKAPPPWEVPGWVVSLFKSRGRQISPDAAQALVDALGSDLRELATASAQLMSYTSAPIGTEDVAALFRGMETQAWTWVDAVLDRDRSAALRHLHALLGRGDNAIGLVMTLAKQMRTVAVVRDGARKPAGAYAKELGVTEGSVKRAFRQAKRFGDEEIRSAFRLLADADLALKGGERGEGEPAELVLEQLVARIAGEAR